MADTSRSQTKFVLKKTVAMIGMMGAGKTAVGRVVAHKLNVSFLDSAAEIERAANRTVPEIFERDGEPFFRKRETEVIARLLEGAPCILSTGGGAYLAAENRKTISARGLALWLDADLELLWSRVRHKNTRPLLRTADPKASLTRIYQERVPIYQKADISVACEDDLSIDEMADKVISGLAARPDVLEVVDA